MGKTTRKSSKEFIRDAKQIHGDEYDYSKVEYINNKKKVEIICNKHGGFLQRPDRHLMGQGCPVCRYEKSAVANSSSKDTFIEKANKIHNNKYDYSKVEYINNHTKVCIICPEHGEFWQTPRGHLQGKGCSKCVGRNRTVDEFVNIAKKIHNDKYDYSKVEYKGSNEKVCIICPEHGEFWQTPHGHLNGKGCMLCSNNKLESEIDTLLKENKIDYVRQKKFPWLKYKNMLSLDFYLPDYRMVIECQGKQHFQPVSYFGGKEAYNEQVKKDLIKINACNEHGIKILYFSHYKDGTLNNINIVKNKEILLKIIKNGGKQKEGFRKSKARNSKN
jgi:very-short-patch-repair endonuclease